MYGRLLLGKRQNSGDGLSLERSCIRPLMRSIDDCWPAGLRGSGSNHSSALCIAITRRSVPTQVLTILPCCFFAPYAVEDPPIAAYAATGALYSCPELSIAQMMRAVLAACATTATLTGRLASRPRIRASLCRA